MREGRRALDLLPVQRDALAGADLIVGFAIICAWTGESDLALEQLAIAAGIPSLLNYGQLKLHPWWDPLRGDARFENLVASLAPKPGENEIEVTCDGKHRLPQSRSVTRSRISERQRRCLWCLLGVDSISRDVGRRNAKALVRGRGPFNEQLP